MEVDWPLTELGEVVDLLTGFPFKSDRYVTERSAPRLLRGDNIVQGTLRWDGVKRWPANATEEFENYWLRQDDVVLAMDRPWIEAGLKYASIRDSDVPSLLVQRVARLRGTQKLDSRFLKFLIGSRQFTQHVLAIQTGTAVPHISGAQIRSFRFRLPPLDEQRAIVRVLGTLDDKIALNRQMNQTLEQIAATLFRSWFVDFDPVRAKAAGRQPEGMDAKTASLFPDRFVESEIPEGWIVSRLEDIARPVRTSVNPSENPEEFFSHYSLPAFDTGRMPQVESGGAIKSNKLLLPDNAVLISKLNPHIPRVWLPFDSNGHRRVASTEFVVAEPHDHSHRSFLYALVSSSEFIQRMQGMVTGTTGSHQRVPPTSILSMPLALPPTALIDAYSTLMRPVYQRVHANLGETATLTQLRDTLLPRLLSGELRVPIDVLDEGAVSMQSPSEDQLIQSRF